MLKHFLIERNPNKARVLSNKEQNHEMFVECISIDGWSDAGG